MFPTYKLLKNSGAAIAALCALLAACTQFTELDGEDAPASVAGAAAAGGSARIIIRAENPAAARTVLPDGLDFATDMALSFTLRGTPDGGAERELRTWASDGTATAYARMTADGGMEVTGGTWTFTLRAYKGGRAVLEKTLAGQTISASGTNTLAFGTMGPAAGGTGDLSLTLYYAGEGVAGVEAGLYTAGADGSLAVAQGYAPAALASGAGIGAYAGKSYAVYARDGVPGGSYIVRFRLYDDGGAVLRTYTEAAIVIPGGTSAATRVLGADAEHAITYDLSGGTYVDGYTPAATFGTGDYVPLPTADDVTRAGYVLTGWRINGAGDAVTALAAGAYGGDVTATAQWAAGGVYTADTVSGIRSLTGNAVVRVTGALDDTAMKNLRSALRATSARVALDLSGADLTGIGRDAFYYCTGLTSVDIPASVTSIWGTAFSCCTNLKSLSVDGGNTKYCSSGNIIYTKDMTELVRAAPGLGGSVTIPASVTSIRGGAFEDCTRLTSVDIPASVTSIGDDAFYYCTGLTSVDIPASVTSIGDNAFRGCTGLRSVTISSGVTSIGTQAFFGCTGLRSVTISSGVTSIGTHAFFDCTHLTSITFTGTVSQWNAIPNHNSVPSTTVVKCTDGTRALD